MVNYKNAKIYKIYSQTDINLCYIGSTTQKLCVRLSGHKAKYRMYLKNQHNFTTSFIVFENCNDYIIELIEKYPCNDKEELFKREGYWQQKIKCVNKIVAGRTKKEYYEQHKQIIAEKIKIYAESNKELIKKRAKKYRQENADVIKERKKKYRAKNIDKIKQKKREYYDKNVDHILEYQKKYRDCHKAKINEYKRKWNAQNKEIISAKKKEYRVKNEAIIRERKRQYYYKNKAIISAKGKEKIKCNCGSEVRKSDYSRHCKSLKHLRFIQTDIQL